MVKEKGMTAKLEDAIAAVLAALTYDGEDLLKTAEAWEHQIELANMHETIPRYAPFAFVGYAPVNPQREGDYELNEQLRIEILYGVSSSAPGVARRGDDNHVGASLIRDLIIAAVEDLHPGATFDCDEFEYSGEVEYIDSPRAYLGGLRFVANWLSQ